MRAKLFRMAVGDGIDDAPCGPFFQIADGECFGGVGVGEPAGDEQKEEEGFCGGKGIHSI